MHLSVSLKLFVCFLLAGGVMRASLSLTLLFEADETISD